MIVVFYAPLAGDPLSGSIVDCLEATADVILRQGRPYRQVAEHRDDWGVTHEVVAGEVTPRDPALISAERLVRARIDLKVMGAALLADNFDPIRNNPERWDPLTPDQKSALLAYRQAVLAWLKAEPDPLNPTPPVPPEI